MSASNAQILIKDVQTYAAYQHRRTCMEQQKLPTRPISSTIAHMVRRLGDSTVAEVHDAVEQALPGPARARFRAETEATTAFVQAFQAVDHAELLRIRALGRTWQRWTRSFVKCSEQSWHRSLHGTGHCTIRAATHEEHWTAEAPLDLPCLLPASARDGTRPEPSCEGESGAGSGRGEKMESEILAVKDQTQAYWIG